jgi:hypothetical protein
MKTLQSTDILSRSPMTAERLFNDVMLIITISDSKLHRLNSVGSFIWKVLENPASVKDICNKIYDEYDNFDKKEGYTEVVHFLRELINKELVFIADAKRSTGDE